jgi:hypothetical protein
MYYDPADRVCLLVADEPTASGRIVAVFALRVEVSGLVGQAG